MLKPEEWCDCYRPVKYNTEEMFENRFYIDQATNITITYIEFMGSKHTDGTHHSSTHGHWSSRTDPDSLRDIQHAFKPPIWRRNLSETFTWLDSLANDDQERVLIMNNGLHEHQFNDKIFSKMVATSALSHFDKFVWKTTSAKLFRDENGVRMVNKTALHYEHDSFMCSLTNITCFDISWTKYLDPKMAFIGLIHFRPPAYNAMNLQLLQILSRGLS